MKKYIKKLLLILAFSFWPLAFGLPLLHAQYTWVESNDTDWQDGYLYHSTATPTGELKIAQLPGWFNPFWSYRKAIRLDNSNRTFLLDYQQMFTIDTSISSSLNGKIQADCSDILFCDSDGTTILSQWRVPATTGTASTQFWVKIPYVSTDSYKDIYMYYGNTASTTTASFPSQVFDFYENFESGINVNKGWINDKFRTSTSTDPPKDSDGFGWIYEGNTSACNQGGIGGDESASITLNDFPCSTTSQVSFYWRCFVEGGDFFNFWIDSNFVDRISGPLNWQPKSVTNYLGPGKHVIRWEYTKDYQGSTSPDEVGLDLIIIRKYTQNPPSVQINDEENVSTVKIYYSSGTYCSEVLNTGGQNSTVLFPTSWTVTAGYESNFKVSMRTSNQKFNILDGEPPSFVDMTNGGAIPPSLQKGQYLQYRVIISSENATATPALDQIVIHYNTPPLRPGGFYGVALSTTSIMWLWTSNSSGTETGFRVYSSTRGYPANGYVDPSGYSSGLLKELGQNTTYWIESNFNANVPVGRFVVAYNNAVGGNAGTDTNGIAQIVTKYTQSIPPEVTSEYFYDNLDNNQSFYLPIANNIYYQNKYLISIATHPNTCNFTSNIVSSTGTLQYYRVFWGTASVHSFPDNTNDIIWGQGGTYSLATSTYADLVGYSPSMPSLNTIIRKPELKLPATLNRDTWYFYCASCNGDNEISSTVVLGPFFFNGAPAPITGLTAAISTQEEGAVVLAWTSPTEDSTFNDTINQGKFLIRYSSLSFISTDSIFNSSPGLLLSTPSITAGTTVTKVVTGLPPGQVFSFAVKTLDSLGNYSELSNVPITASAKVAKIVFTQVSAETAYVGDPVKMTIQAQDINSNPLRLFSDAVIEIRSDSARGEFTKELTPAAWSSGGNLTIPLGTFPQEYFYYRDKQSGTPTVTCFESPSQPWAQGNKTLKIIPGLATQFRITHNAALPGRALQYEYATAAIKAMDDYGNVSDKYMGAYISSSTLPEQTVSPSTHAFTPADAGQKSPVRLDNYYMAGPAYLTAEETTDEKFRDIFYSGLGIWAAGDKGTIKKTADGGISWVTQVFGTSTANGLFGVHIAPDFGFAVGKNGLIKRTTDMGMYWTAQNQGAETFYGVYFVNDSTGFAVGTNAKVLRSTDTGLTWTDSSFGITPGTELRSIYFLDESTGFISGNGVLYKTIDAGANWSAVTLPGSPGMLYSVKFLSSNNNVGYISGSGGKLYKTADGGNTWASLASTTTLTLYDVAPRDINTAIAVGDNGTIVKTSDGGTNWTALSSTRTLYACDFTNIGIAAGDLGTIVTSDFQGNAWNRYVMSGKSDPIYWNGTIVTPVSGRTTPLIQGRANQAICTIGVRTLYGGTCRWTGFQIQRTGTSQDSEVNSVKFYRGASLITESPFISGVANLSFPSVQLITQSTTYFQISLNVSSTAVVSNTLGITIPQDVFNLVQYPDVKFARNNLPYIVTPVPVVPSSTTARLAWENLSSSYEPGQASSETIKQGYKDAPMMKIKMQTDVVGTQTQWTQIKLERKGNNTADSDASLIKIYKDSIFPDLLIGSGTFSAAVAVISVDTQIITSADPAPEYYITMDIDSNANPSIPQQDATLGIGLRSTTDYITLVNMLGEKGMDGIVPVRFSDGQIIVPGDQVIASSNVRINQAKNSVTLSPVYLPVPEIYQSETKAFLNFKVSIDSNTATWLKLRVDRSGTCSDSDISEVDLYRDADANDTFNVAVDTFVASGSFSSGSSELIFPQNKSEEISWSAPNYMTYFVVLKMSKRAAINNTVNLSITNNTYLTLAGVDKVLPDNFPIVSYTATIKDFPDSVNPRITDITPVPPEVRIDEANVGVLKLDLTTYCDASLLNLNVSIDGNAGNISVKTIKLYKDTNGDGILDKAQDGSILPNTDLLISTASFDTFGKAVLAMPAETNFDCADRSQIRFTSSTLIVDTTQAFFITYDFDVINSTPDTMIGLGIDYNGFSYNLPNRSYNFGFKTVRRFRLLDINTPTPPIITPIIKNAVPLIINNESTYFTDNKFKIDLNIYSEVDDGIQDIGEFRYALSGYSLTTSTDVPDLMSWSISASPDITFMFTKDVQHNKSYYVWLEVSNKDMPAFVRRNQLKFKVDLTPPPDPAPPSHDTSGSIQQLDNSLITWEAVDDPESGILTYELQECSDTSPLWVIVSSNIPGNQTYFTKTGMEPGKFYYYRLRAQNYTGAWGGISATSSLLYSALPSEHINQVANYPNPFDSRYTNTTITYVLRENAEVTMRIFDLLGNLARTIRCDRGANPGGIQGTNNVTWDGTNDRGEKLAQGMYILLIDARADGQTVRKKWKIGVIH